MAGFLYHINTSKNTFCRAEPEMMSLKDRIDCMIRIVALSVGGISSIMLTDKCTHMTDWITESYEQKEFAFLYMVVNLHIRSPPVNVVTDLYGPTGSTRNIFAITEKEHHLYAFFMLLSDWA